MDGPDERRASLWNVQNRKAHWMANNHLQYLDHTGALHPFYNRELIELHLAGSRAHFTWALYQQLFGRFCPAVADLPHSKEIPATFHASLRWSWVHWGHVPGLVNNALSARWARGSVNRSRVAPRLGAYGGGVSRWAYLVRYFHQVAVLMRRLDERGIEPDWKAL
jgi:hypothetical protein